MPQIDISIQCAAKSFIYTRKEVRICRVVSWDKYDMNNPRRLSVSLKFMQHCMILLIILNATHMKYQNWHLMTKVAFSKLSKQYDWAQFALIRKELKNHFKICELHVNHGIFYDIFWKDWDSTSLPQDAKPG